MNSGGTMVTKIGFLQFLKGSTRLRKLRQISESPKPHWISVPWNFSFAVFDLRAKTNFEGETLYRAAISVSPSDSGMREISDSRSFLWVSSERTKWPGNDFSWFFLSLGRDRVLWGLVSSSSGSRALQASGVWVRILLGGRIAVVVQGESGVGGAISQWLLSSCIILIAWLLLNYMFFSN